jgi:hypothetical protein
MSDLYHWHAPFVAAFLAFVVVFVVWSGIRGRGPGK